MAGGGLGRGRDGTDSWGLRLAAERGTRPHSSERRATAGLPVGRSLLRLNRCGKARLDALDPFAGARDRDLEIARDN